MAEDGRAAEWAVLEPMIEACRAYRKTQHHELRRTVEVIIWRYRNGANWGTLRAEYEPLWPAKQTFISPSTDS
jgi:transposase